MDCLDSFILGLVQGLAEYLPISSSGHLEICQDLLNLDLSGKDALQFDLILHIATVLSTIVILWHEFSGLCTSFFTLKRDTNTSLVWKILVSSIPVAVVGICFKDYVETFFGSNLTIVGICLIVTATLLAFAYFSRTLVNSRGSHEVRSASDGRQISYLDAFIIGCAQAIAVLPGLSRSGSTIATGIILGNKRDQVAKFSFLMVIIPILGEALLTVVKLINGKAGAESIGLLPATIGFVTAFITGCIACKWMINLVKRGKLVWFSIYCVIIGIICLIF